MLAMLGKVSTDHYITEQIPMKSSQSNFNGPKENDKMIDNIVDFPRRQIQQSCLPRHLLCIPPDLLDSLPQYFRTASRRYSDADLASLADVKTGFSFTGFN